MGFSEAMADSAMVRFKFEDGRAGAVKHAADIKVGNAGCEGAFAAFVLRSGYSGFTA